MIDDMSARELRQRDVIWFEGVCGSHSGQGRLLVFWRRFTCAVRWARHARFGSQGEQCIAVQAWTVGRACTIRPSAARSRPSRGRTARIAPALLRDSLGDVPPEVELGPSVSTCPLARTAFPIRRHEHAIPVVAPGQVSDAYALTQAVAGRADGNGGQHERFPGRVKSDGKSRII